MKHGSHSRAQKGVSVKQGQHLGGMLLFILFGFGMAVWGSAVQSPKAAATDSVSVSVGAEICRIVREERGSFQIGSQPETTEENGELLRFYGDPKCLPAWSNESGIAPQTLYMIHAIKRSAADGLDVYDRRYHLESILTLMGMIRSENPVSNNVVLLAQLDILLSDAYMVLGKHLYGGVLPPEGASESWKFAAKKSPDFAVRLRQALLKGDIPGSLDTLSPDSPSYQGLKTALARYLRIQEEGGWEELPTSDPKRLRKESGFIEEVRERLRGEGDLAADENSDEGFQEALVAFQRRHGIKADGIVGSETLAKLNRPVEEKIQAIRLNMERWRWMAPMRETSYIAVNIPDFSLSLIEEDAAVLTMRAILGKEGRHTPLFSATMRYIVVNPYWQVPATILREDIIPKMAKNSRYLKEEKIRMFKYSDEKGEREINPAAIDWKHISAERFPYLLRQDAGEKNVLGRIKFIFPNPYDIYIHDTPHKNLFEKQKRSFSSGCIRVEEPLLLAKYLLEEGAGEVEALVEGGKTKTIVLPEPVKVYIGYWTVWTQGEGEVQFRDDVYGYDRELAEKLGW